MVLLSYAGAISMLSHTCTRILTSSSRSLIGAIRSCHTNDRYQMMNWHGDQHDSHIRPGPRCGQAIRDPGAFSCGIRWRLTVNIRRMCDRGRTAPVRRGNRRAACGFVGRAVDLTYDDHTRVCVCVQQKDLTAPRCCRHVCEVCEHGAAQWSSVGTSEKCVCVYAL